MPRKPLVVALAAAGLLAGVAALPAAQSGPVFVPELALVDGALCVKQPASRTPLLVRLAAASKPKTGISPAAPAMAAAAGATEPDDDPPLMEGLGDLHRRITTATPEAQRYFDQGLRLAWGFNHAEARRAFRKAQRLDPDCAMCYWGEAWVLGPNINAPMEDAALAPALAAAQQAASLASRATLEERALIAAMALRYAPDAKRAELDARYAAAMREAAVRFPHDLDVALLYADALMNVSPWDYWESGGKQAKRAVAELLPTLQRVLARSPDHPAAIHLYIHTVEASDDPQRAERYADRLAKLAPGAGHLVHMPSHIYYRIGRYRDSLAANQAAVEVDEAYIAREKPTGVYPLGYYPHNVHFVLVSAEMAGDAATVLASAAKLAAVIPDEAARALPVVQPMKAAPYFAHARFSDLDTVLALPDPGVELPYLQAVRHYARGVALAQAERLPAARAELAHIERLAAATDFASFNAVNIPAREVMQIAAHVLRARVAQAHYDTPGAIAELEAALPLYDALPYMEPPYWPFPVRQTLGALLVLQGEHARARDVFGAALARTPNNAWALFGLGEAYARDGKKKQAREVKRRLTELWLGERSQLDLARL